MPYKCVVGLWLKHKSSAYFILISHIPLKPGIYNVAIYKKGFKAYLQLEKSLSENSVEAYIHDIDKFTQYLAFSQCRYKTRRSEFTTPGKIFTMDQRIRNDTFFAIKNYFGT